VKEASPSVFWYPKEVKEEVLVTLSPVKVIVFPLTEEVPHSLTGLQLEAVRVRETSVALVQVEAIVTEYWEMVSLP